MDAWLSLVMLYGSGSSTGASGWANFNRNVEPLVAAGYRVILMDCPGWSKSDPIVCTGSRSELNAGALKGLLDPLDLERVHLIGNSMGGHRAVAFALANPGHDYRFVPMDIGIKLLWGMPNAELHIFNRCGHWAQWEHADKFNRMVPDFLAH